MTQIIAVVALILFVISMVIIGIVSSKYSKTLDGFILGGRNMGPWLSAFAYATTYFSAVIFIGYAGMHGWKIGLGSVWIGIGNAVLGCLIAWKLLAKPTRRMTHKLNINTTPGFLEKRFCSRGLKLYSAVIIFIFLVPYAAGVYKGLGVLFSIVFPGSSEMACMLIVAGLTAIYLVLGGYVATALNDFIQGIIILIGVVIMVVMVISRPEVGGLINGLNQLANTPTSEMLPDGGRQLLNIWGGSAWKFLLVNIALTSFGTWGLPQMIHKYYAINDESNIKKATIITTLFALIVGVGAYFIGSFGRLFVEVAETGAPVGGFDMVMPELLLKTFSNGVFANIMLSIIMLLLLSASMSTLASVVLTSSSAIAVDIMGDYRNNLSDKNQMIVLRSLCILFVALSFIFASLNISFIVNIMSFSWGVVAGSFIGPFIWGLYSKKTTKAGAWAGALSGLVVVGTCIAITTLSAGFDVAKSLSPEFGVLAMVVSIIIVPIVSTFTKKLPDEHIEKCFSK